MTGNSGGCARNADQTSDAHFSRLQFSAKRKKMSLLKYSMASIWEMRAERVQLEHHFSFVKIGIMVAGVVLAEAEPNFQFSPFISIATAAAMAST